MTIKEEFEKDFAGAFPEWVLSKDLAWDGFIPPLQVKNHHGKRVALWAAQWMAERCAQEFEKSCSFSQFDPGNPVNVIRQIAKELE